MKYFLVLGIEYKFFQNPADITIHVGNTFIDTFRLDRDFLTANILPHIESKWFPRDWSYWLTRADQVEQWAKMPVLFKVYEIDDSAIEGKLKIKVENSNSDYTNGFMKKSSLIKFPIVALFKKELVRNRGEMMMKALIEFDDRWLFYKRKKGILYKIKMELLHGDLKEKLSRWPNAHSIWISRENEIHEKSAVKDVTWWLGGSFTAEFTIKTKHRTKYLAPVKDTKIVGFPWSGGATNLLLASCSQLLNIYNEDQRSNHTKD